MTKAQRNQEFEKHINEIAEGLKDEGVTFILTIKTRDGGAVTYSNGENDNLMTLTTILVDHLFDWLHKSTKEVVKVIGACLEYFGKI